jgi:hypothetical protein
MCQIGIQSLLSDGNENACLRRDALSNPSSSKIGLTGEANRPDDDWLRQDLRQHLQRTWQFSQYRATPSRITIPRVNSGPGGSLADKTERDESRLFYVDPDGRNGASFLANERPHC